METIVLQKKISLPPYLLDRNINDHIYNKVDTLLNGNCTQENGYVIGIDRDIKVMDNELCTNGSLLLNIEFSVSTLKPREGQILKGEVCMIFEDGIFVEIQGKMKVLIPRHKIPKYTFDKIDGVFKKKKKTIKQGDIVKVRLELIKYERKGFNCIGLLEV